MAPTTEFAKLPLKPGIDLKKGSDDYNLLTEGFSVLLDQPGCQRIYWGQQVEDQSILRMIIDWDDISAHKTFMKSDAYGPFVKNLGAIMGGAPELHHIGFKPHPPRTALSDTTSGATEILSVFFPTTTAAADKDKIQSDIEAALGNIAKATPSLKGTSGGWLHEESVDYEKGPDGKATVLRFVIGWDSVEAHMSTRETQVFKDNIGALRGAPGLLGLEVFHINPVEVQHDGA